MSVGATARARGRDSPARAPVSRLPVRGTPWHRGRPGETSGGRVRALARELLRRLDGISARMPARRTMKRQGIFHEALTASACRLVPMLAVPGRLGVAQAPLVAG